MGNADTVNSFKTDVSEQAVALLLHALLCWQQRLLLRLQLLTRNDSDVVLHLLADSDDGVEGDTATVTVSAHAAVLAHRSPKMGAMIRFTLAQREQQYDIDESEQSISLGHKSDPLVLDMQSVSAAALRALVQYMYTDCLPAESSADLLLDLVFMADEHIMPHLSALLDQQLVSMLSCDNSVQCFCAAQQYQLNHLRTVSALFVIKQYGGFDMYINSFCAEDGNGNDEADVEDLLAETLQAIIM